MNPSDIPADAFSPDGLLRENWRKCGDCGKRFNPEDPEEEICYDCELSRQDGEGMGAYDDWQ